MAEASPLQDSPKSSRGRRRTRKQVDGNTVMSYCDMCGSDVTVDPSGLCRLGHRLMTSEAAVERHIAAGSAVLDRRISGHIPAPEDYVSYQDLSVEIDLESAAASGLPHTAPSFSIALPSAASRQVPVSIGRKEDSEESTAEPSGSYDAGLDFFVGGANPATQADHPDLHDELPVDGGLQGQEGPPLGDDPLWDRAVDESEAVVTLEEVPAAMPTPTAEDTAPLAQHEILEFEETPGLPESAGYEASAEKDLPVMDPTPELPSGKGTLQIPERLRRPLPARDDLELDPAFGDLVDLTSDGGSIDVSSLIDADDDYELEFADTIPDVSSEVSIDQELAVLESTELQVEDTDEPWTGEPRMFTRRLDEDLSASSVLATSTSQQVAADLDPSASSVLDGSRSESRPEGSAGDGLSPVADEVVPGPVRGPVATDGVSTVAGSTGTWSSSALRSASDGRRNSLAGALQAPSATPEDADWEQMLEPRRSWWDRLAAVIFVLCLTGVAVYLAQSI